MRDETIGVQKRASEESFRSYQPTRKVLAHGGLRVAEGKGGGGKLPTLLVNWGSPDPKS